MRQCDCESETFHGSILRRQTPRACSRKSGDGAVSPKPHGSHHQDPLQLRCSFLALNYEFSFKSIAGHEDEEGTNQFFLLTIRTRTSRLLIGS